MKMVVLKPKINSKFHFGEGSLERNSQIFHSNSLFSAIVNNYVKLYGKENLERDIEKIKNIRLSSLLYKIDDIYLIPKPEHPKFYKLKENSGIKPKDIKKIQFFSIKAYRELLDGELKWEEGIKHIIDYRTINKKIVISKKEIKKIKKIFNIKVNKLKNAKISLISRQIEQKIAMDRLKDITLEKDDRGQLYNVEFMKLNENVEFYFLIDYNITKDGKKVKDEKELSDEDKKFIKRLEASIKLIEDEGLGGKRSIGAGFFEKVEIVDLPKDFAEILKDDSKYNNLEYKMLLGVGIPNKEDIKNIEYYKLIEIGGYIYSLEYLTKPKRNILALTEGSIVKNNFIGWVEDLSPTTPDKLNHKVYAHGKPILIPFEG
ncbi:CRISPR-associated protein, Csm4 [Methanocaldococcus bathoardescens]|uniref:CRISPR system Cms protein Csm4 n=1 Tax=Methanocaldococcus bathoardescens TaxID=1301915 RepID=A0A076LIL0_9EURY|nr:type III-A CRISPR-associated RAMP protein Csm4 [Methanocaldococcus bathoardescens]AIJ06328.1 CRISPR-associated protein, Csm4 [Methanocaldococcus bathoardescens]